MPGHSNAKGNTSYVKQKFLKNIAAGEKLSGAEFDVAFDGYDDLSVLVRTTQIPALGRADVEDFGPNGLKFVQQGPLENSGQVTMMCVETIKGVTLKALTDMVLNKKYVNITIKPTPESLGGGVPAGTGWRLEHCLIRMDNVDLSTEDVTAIVKPNITITYNWKEPV